MTASRRFLARLLIVAAGAAVVRVIVAIVMRGDQSTGLSDEFGYLVSGQLLADGEGFINPFAYALDKIEYQSAIHPPLFSMVLSVPSSFGLESTLGFRIFNGLIGAALVFAVGLLGREVANERAGLIAAVLAALYPHLWISDTAIMPEALFCLLVVVGLLAAYRYWRQPSWPLAAATSAAFSLAALTRSEGVLYLPFVALLLVLSARRTDWSQRWRAAAVVVIVGGLLVGPWVLRNLITFEKPTTMASGTGHVIAYGNCDATYSGDFLGYWHDSCALKEFPDGDESVVNEAAQQQGTDYIKDHLSRQPVVVAARVGRVFEVYRPSQNVEFNRFFERRGDLPSHLALWAYYLLLIPAAWGLVTMRRHGLIVWPMLMIVAVAAFTAAISLGITRYRAPVDAILPVLAAVGIDAWLRRSRARTETSDAAGPPGTPVPTGP